MSCTQEPVCPDLGDCGGALPIGGWVMGAGNSSCSEDLHIPLRDKRLVDGDKPPARLPPPEEAQADWCSDLVAGSGDVLSNPPFFYAESPPVGAASILYNGDGTYSVGIFETGTYLVEFSPACMRQFGAEEGCDAFQVALVELITRQANAADAPPIYRNMTCTQPTTEPGCTCAFDLAQPRIQRGTFHALSGNELFHAGDPAFSSTATYCNQTGRLQLTGASGSYLFNHPGLRTLDLSPVNCADGAQGSGEEGLDCGVACGTPCPNCYDGVQNGTEEGVDCGAACGVVCPP